jgi:imidazolonepropionase-like amidohydrolase
MLYGSGRLNPDGRAGASNHDMRKRVIVWFFLPSALALNGLASPNADKPNLIGDVTVIKNVTVMSPEQCAPLAHASVVIRNGRIARIGTDLAAGAHAKQIDGHGGFLIPGLIDSHVHVGNMGPLDDDAIEKHPELLRAYRGQLPRSYLAFGFTTLVDLDLKPTTLEWFNAAPVHPNLCSCGRGVRIIGGYMALKPPKDETAAAAANFVYEPSTKDWPANLDPNDYSPVRAVARAQDAGAICLKTFVEPGFGGAAHWPTPQPETLSTLRDEAKRHGLVFVVHANALESWRTALDARPDVIAHGIWHWDGDRMNTKPPPEMRDVIQRAARANVAVQPTLQAVYGDLSIFEKSLLKDPRLAEALPREIISYLTSDEGQTAQRAQTDEYRQAITHLFGSNSIDPAKVMAVGPERATAILRVMLAENVKLLFGTDTPANEGVGNPPGLHGRFELGRWADAGVPLPRILRAATLDNAKTFGLSDRGTIEVGKRADLLLLRKDPFKTIAAYDSIETVFLNGNALPRAALMPKKEDLRKK